MTMGEARLRSGAIKAGSRNRQFIACAAMVAASLLGGCQAAGLGTSVGPTRGAILKSTASQQVPGIQVIPVTNPVAQQLAMVTPRQSIADAIGDASPVGTVVGIGDALEVTVWEAPPAVLFSSGLMDTRIGSPIQASRPGVLPELMVGPSGTITVPFAGQVPAAGRTLRQIEQTIVGRLHGKANQPQAIVRIVRNATANISVVGDVNSAGRIPLTPRGERLLDAIAQAGGTRQPVERMTIQVTRGDRTITMPLQDVIRDARHNIVLQRDDVVTALYQPFAFTVLGAAGKNEEVRFEGTGLPLSKALGRIGGLQDMRADPKGVFVFRWEPTERVRGMVSPSVVLPPDQVPVVYRVDLTDPATYFAAQNFPMRDGDVVYVSNSPMADFQRFVGILSQSILPVGTFRNAVGIP